MTCNAAGGCRPLQQTEAPTCHRFVRLVRADSVNSEVRVLDSSAGEQIRGIPSGLLPRRCYDALQEYICSKAIGGCAQGSSIAPCRSVCQHVHDSCSWLILTMMPRDAQRMLECEQYTPSSWPFCAQPSSPQLDRCVSVLEDLGPCATTSAALVEAPCGACQGSNASALRTFRPLPYDNCGLCNGDNTSCLGCDGARGSFDACAECQGNSSSCHALDTDPRLLGYLASTSLALGLILALAAVMFRRRRPRPSTSETAAHPAQSEPLGERWAKKQRMAFEWLGRSIARRPYGVIAVALAVASLAGCGLFALQIHRDPLRLWLPMGSPSAVSAERWQATMGLPRSRMVLVVLEARNGAPIPMRTGLHQALSLHNHIMRLRVGGQGLQAQNSSAVPGLLHDRDGMASPLGLWEYNQAVLSADRSPGRTLARALSPREGPEGFLSALYGGQVAFGIRPTESSGGGDGSLRGLQLLYVLDGSPERQEAVAAWERALAASLLGPDADSNAWNLWVPHLSTEQLLSDELNGAISGDITLIVLGYCIMSIYTSAFMGSHQDFLRGRGAVASAAVISVGLATLAAFGICGAAGVVYNDTVNIVIFVLMGVGVDDAFVIVRALEDVEERSANGEVEALSDEDVPGRLGQALGECGSAILLSSVTNALAFGLGSTTKLPALRSFCVYASVGMITDFALQTTFFMAVLALDERRRLAGRCTVLPCVSAASATSRASLPFGSVVAGAKNRAGTWRKAFARSLTTSAPIRFLVLLAFLVSSSVSIWAAYTMPVGLDPRDLVPKGSRSATYFQQAEALLPEARQLVEVVVQHRHIASWPDGLSLDALAASAHADLRRLRAALVATDFVGSKNVGPLWLDIFAEWLRLSGRPPASSLAPTELQSLVASFVESPTGSVLERQAAFSSDGGAIRATRLRLLAQGYGARRMVALRATLEKVGLGDAAFLHSPADIYYEQDAIMLLYTFQNLLFVMVAVLSAVLIVVVSPTFVLVVAFCILSCCTHMFGWMALTGTPLNALSLIPLLLAVGLCVDYCTHIVHAFWSERGDSPKRAASALRVRGAAVANGGLSTALSQVLLAFSESLIFTIFFKMMCGVVVVGLVHALVILPVCFSLVPGTTAVKHQRLDRVNQDSPPGDTWAGPPADVVGSHLDNSPTPTADTADTPDAASQQQ